MIPLLIASAALAAPAVDEVEAALSESGPGPQAVVACSPMRPLMDFVSSIPLPPQVSLEAGATSNGRWWLELVQPGRAEAAGFDLDGAVVVSTWGDGHATFQLPFSGDAAQAEDVAGHLLPAEIQVYGDDWSPPETATWSATRTESSLVLVKGDRQQAATRTPLVDLVHGLPAVDGCVAYFAPEGGFGDEEELLGVAAFIPLEKGNPLKVRLATEDPPPEVLTRSVGAPVSGTTSQPPTMVLVLGFSLLDLMSEPLLGEQAVPPEDIERIRKRIQLPPGATLAMHGRPPQGDFTALVPITNAKGRPLRPRKMIKAVSAVLETEDVEFEKSSRTSFRAAFKDRTLYGRAIDRGLAISTHPGFVDEVAEGVGDPWVTDEMGPFLAEWPLALVGSTPANEGGTVEFRAGVRATGGLWELGATMKMPETSPETRAMIASMVGAVALPNALQAYKRMQRSEVSSNVDELFAAQQSYRTEHGAWLVLTPAPRPPDALGRERVAWAAEGDWESIGWQPGGMERGSYWVEIDDAGGLMVHGAIDADGDGVPAHYVRTEHSEEPQLLTPETVF